MPNFPHTVAFVSLEDQPGVFADTIRRIESNEEMALGGTRIVFGRDRLSGHDAKLVVVGSDAAVLTIFDGGNLSAFSARDTLGADLEADV